MAKILTTKACAATLEHIIRKCEKELYIFSFSYIVSDPFITRLKQASEKGIVINLVYGKSIKEESLLKLKKISNLNIFYFPNLHAKIFANETHCMIGSMNFSEASEINNTELGVLLTASADEIAFKEAIEHCKELLHEAKKEFSSSKQHTITESKIEFSKNLSPVKENKIEKTQEIKFEYKSNLKFHTELNFFYPSLVQLLEIHYPTMEIELDRESILIDEFANKEVYIEVSGRLDVVFEDSDEFEDFKRVNEGFLKNKLKFFRIFWNNDVINIYLPKAYDRKINPKELKLLVDNHFEAIQTFYDLLK